MVNLLQGLDVGLPVRLYLAGLLDGLQALQFVALVGDVDAVEERGSQGTGRHQPAQGEQLKVHG